MRKVIFNSLFLLFSNLFIITQIYLVTPLEPQISRGPKSQGSLCVTCFLVI